MSFPSGPQGGGPQGGYPGRPPQQPAAGYGQPPAQRANPFADLDTRTIATLVVVVLGLASYFCSFTSDAASLGVQVMLLLGGGLLAGLHVLPKAPRTLPFAALLSAVGGLSVLAVVIQSSGAGATPTITIIILILGLIQFLASVFALLVDYELIKFAPKPAVPYGVPGTFPQSGPFPHAGPGHHGSAQPQPPVPAGQPQGAGPANQATQYVAGPQQPAAPAPQSTMFMHQPGQISQQQPGSTGTPPGGFPGVS